MCPLGDSYPQLTKLTNKLIPPDVDKKASQSKNAKKVKEIREWLDSFDISYKVTAIKADVYKGFEAEEILASLPEADRSCKVTFRDVYVERVANFCRQYCGKIPTDPTIRKWLRSDNPYIPIKKYVERTNKKSFSGRVSDFISLPLENLDPLVSGAEGAV